MNFLLTFFLFSFTVLGAPKVQSGIALYEFNLKNPTLEILPTIFSLKPVIRTISLPDVSKNFYPVVGDWDGNGIDELGFMEVPKLEDWKNTKEFNLMWHLSMKNMKNGYLKIEVPFKSYTFEKVRVYFPVSGKWTVGSTDYVGLYYETDAKYLSKEKTMCCRSHFYLKGENSSYQFELPLDCEKYKTSFCNGSPIVGDWDGDGKDGVGIFFRGFNQQQLGFWIFINDVNNPSKSATTLVFGNTIGFPMPLSGDWDGDGKDDLGLYYYLPKHYDLWIFLNDMKNVNNTKTLRFGTSPLRPIPLTGKFFPSSRKP